LIELLQEHEAAGEDALPTSARFLYYELVQRGILKKHDEVPARTDGKKGRRPDQDLHDALMWLREKEVVPWDWITDETRSLEDHTGWASINAWATTSVRYIRLDPWQGRAPMILTESRSLAGALRKLAIQYATKLAATKGQVGGFLRTVVAPQLKSGDTVLYCGDWDWQGGQIEANTRRVLERLVGGELDWTRIALTEEQVDRYDLRRLQIMKRDKRYKPGTPGWRFPAVETEALQQQVIVQIVRDALDAELPEPLEDVLEREARQRGEIERLLKRRRER
jgi:hypothetical protein